MFSFHISTEKDFTEIVMKGKLLSTYEGEPILQQLKSESVDSPKIIINLTELQYVNSEGISLLLKIFTYARNLGGEVVITNVSTDLRNLFIITKLNSIFSIFETKEEAIQELIQLTK